MESEGGVVMLPLETVEMFGGFTSEDFEVFTIAGFEPRMAQLRAQVKPKLIQIGKALAPLLTEALGETVYPHVAQHLRRTVNPPVETWVAFAREKRAYKPFVHLRVGVSAERARITVFVEDYADEKPLFSDNLAKNAEALADHFSHHPHILAYEIPDSEGQPSHGTALDADTLRAFAERMQKVKGQHAVFGIAFAASHPVVASGPEFLSAVLEAAKSLKPFYDCGKLQEAETLDAQD